MAYDMTKLTAESTTAEHVASESNRTISRDDTAGVREMATGSVLPEPCIIIPTRLIAEIFARGISTKNGLGKELKATLTVNKGALETHVDKTFYEGMRLGINAFARKV
jgi:hypothetical protein